MSNNPDLIPVPFAQDGQKTNIPVERGTSDPVYRASWVVGFPPDTRIPVEVGGEAPDGLDFNGVLNALSQAIVFLQKGNAYKFDASLTPYPIGALVRSNDGLRTFQSTVASNNNNPNSNMSGWRLYNGSGFVINNLTSTATDSALSAAQGKVLQDNKIATAARGSANGVASLDANTRVPVAQLPTATISAAGAVQLNNSLTSTSTTQALTAAQGKALQDNKFDKAGGVVSGGVDVKGIIRGNSYLDLGIGAPDGNKGISFYNQDGTGRGSIRSLPSGEMRFAGATSYSFDKTVDADISGNAASATNCSRSIVAGNGLSGGGDLTANRTVTLGTPGTVTASTGNTVSASSHTHNLDIDGFFQGTKSTNGYQRLPGGLILQWGSNDAQIAGATIPFPITFPNSVLSVVITDIATAGAASNLAVRTRGNNNFVVISNNNNDYFNWFAIGY